MPAGAVVVDAVAGTIDRMMAAARRATGTARRRPIRSGNGAPSYRDGAVSAPSVGRVAALTTAARWGACNLRSTSLMRANIEWGAAEGGFLDARTLARRIVAHDQDGARLGRKEVSPSHEND